MEGGGNIRGGGPAGRPGPGREPKSRGVSGDGQSPRAKEGVPSARKRYEAVSSQLKERKAVVEKYENAHKALTHLIHHELGSVDKESLVKRIQKMAQEYDIEGLKTIAGDSGQKKLNEVRMQMHEKLTEMRAEMSALGMQLTSIRLVRQAETHGIDEAVPGMGRPKVPYDRYTAYKEGRFTAMTNRFELPEKVPSSPGGKPYLTPEQVSKLMEKGFKYVYNPHAVGDCGVLVLLTAMIASSGIRKLQELASKYVNKEEILTAESAEKGEGSAKESVLRGLELIGKMAEYKGRLRVEDFIVKMGVDKESPTQVSQDLIAAIREIMRRSLPDAQLGEIGKLSNFLGEGGFRDISVMSRDIDSMAIQAFSGQVFGKSLSFTAVDYIDLPDDSEMRMAVLYSGRHYLLLTKNALDPLAR